MTNAFEDSPRTSRVLMVDDDISVLTFGLRWLMDAHHETVACHSVHTARLLLDAWQPDVLVTDIQVDGANGLFLAILHSQRVPPLHVVVITGFDDAVLRGEAEQLGALFLTKPLNREQLIAAVQRRPTAT